jgi:hypothetical protein
MPLMIDCHAHIYSFDEKRYPPRPNPFRPPSYLLDSTRDHRDWICGVCTLDPDDSRSPALLRQFVRRYGVKSLRIPSNKAKSFDDPGVRALWKVAPAERQRTKTDPRRERPQDLVQRAVWLGRETEAKEQFDKFRFLKSYSPPRR